MAALIWSHFLFNNWFYSTFYSDGRPYLVALFIQQLNNCFIQLLIHCQLSYSTLVPLIILSLLQLIYFFFFLSLEKRCLTWIRTRDLLICSLRCLPLDHHHTHHHHTLKAIIKLITTPRPATPLPRRRACAQVLYFNPLDFLFQPPK